MTQMPNRITIGGTPFDEPCAQTGFTIGAADLNKLECRAYIAAIIKVIGTPPDDVSFFVKSEDHDFGPHYEVEVRYGDNERAAAYAAKAEKGLARWEDARFWPPVLYVDSQAERVLREPELWDMTFNHLCVSSVEAMKAGREELAADGKRPPPAPPPLHGIEEWGGPTTPLNLVGKPPILAPAPDHKSGTGLWEYSQGHVGFYGYLMVAEAVVMKAFRLGLLDLPDRMWRDAYDDRLDPAAEAQAAIGEVSDNEFDF